MNRKTTAIVTLALALCVVTMFGVLFGGTASASQPQPLFAPTPAANVNLPGIRSAPVTFYQTLVITADGNSTAQNVQDHSLIDLQWVSDQTLIAGAGNTTTLTLQHSNDGINWVDGAAVLSASGTDNADLQQFALFGRYARINANVTNANPLTVTVIGLAK